MLKWYKAYLLLRINNLEKEINKKLDEIEKKINDQVKESYKGVTNA